jgi:hypothetical protein
MHEVLGLIPSKAKEINKRKIGKESVKRRMFMEFLPGI